MSNHPINLYSDTQTLPTAAMRRAIAGAEVGDEQANADPSVNRLCERVADLLGKEAAVFLPSGTMCNEIAIRVHCRAGDEIIADRTAHILNFEGGGPAALTGAQIHTVDGAAGVFTPEQVRAAIRPRNRYAPVSRLLSVEQTANIGGGTVWPVERLEAVAAVAREHGLATHLDGARLLNAVTASGRPAREHAAPFDTAWIDMSKGLGCPVGAVLAAPAALLDDIWRWKQRLGGAMRQAGFLAAAGLHALDHHVDRLVEDHANARRFAEGIADLPGLVVDPRSVHTNIVFFDVSGTGTSARIIVERLAEHGVLLGALESTRVRAVTHLDVDAAAIERAIAAVRAVCG